MSRFDLSTPAGLRAAHRDYLWNDHAFLRVRFQNAHWISDELVRTNQPSPKQLEVWKARGIKTVINLRGGFDSSFYLLEKQACERLGLTMVDFTVTSREAPSKVRVRGAKEMFQTIQYPALMHCKSGADRAGIMSVLYMHFRQGKPIREAMTQLGWKYLHVRAGKTGVLDYVFDRYLAEGEPKGQDFLDWVESDAYDPVKIKEDFKAQWWANVLTEKLLRRE
ncbi:MAG: protein tyrosine phosphatase [Proteobacteria bacterium]|nr:protein tyrosine phosphatase [Pseudomonadota bacterium]MBW3617463.1 protein tyrosine phosphatase [Pseudomonadota bacterium]